MYPIAYRPSRLRRIAQRGLGAFGLLAFLSACGVSDSRQVTSAAPTFSAAAPPTGMAAPYPAPYPPPPTASSAVASPTSTDSYPYPPPYIPPESPVLTPLPPPPLPLVVTPTIDLSILQSPAHAAHHRLFYSEQKSQTGLMLADIEDNTHIWLTRDLVACRPTNESFREETVSWSADLRFLAIFCYTRNIQGSFYLLDQQQGIFRAVQPDPGPGYRINTVIWSPQGHQLLFQEARTLDPPQHREEVWHSLDAATGVRNKLMEFVAYSNAIWAPDGQGVVLSGQVLEGEQSLSVVYTMKPDGSQARRILQQDTGEHAFFEGWSADEQSVYIDLRTIYPSDQGDSWGLDLNSGALTHIYRGIMDISPDAHYAIVGYAGFDHTQILISLDRKEAIRQLPNSSYTTWLPDGRLLIRDEDDLALGQQVSDNKVYISTITGEEHIILSGLSGVTSAAVSPDNSFFAIDNSSASQITIVDVNGQQHGALAKNGSYVFLKWFAEPNP